VVYPRAGKRTGAVDAARGGLIEPILIGPRKRIEELAASENIKLMDYQLVDVEDPIAAASHATSLVRSGKLKIPHEGQPAYR
jgi:phosphate acetyltransferase